MHSKVESSPVIIPLTDIRERAKERFPGYYRFVTSAGQIVDDSLHLSEERWRLLVKELRGPLAGLIAPDDVVRFRQSKCGSCKEWNASMYFGMGGCALCKCTKLKLFWAESFCPKNPPEWNAVEFG